MADTRLRAGDLRHRVSIKSGQLEGGATIETGVPMAIAALPLAFQVREGLAAGGQQSATTYTVTCRYRTDITESMVLTEQCCTERTFQIVAIIPRDRLDALDMTCIESERAA